MKGILAIAVLFSCSAFAGTEHKHPEAKIAPQFESMKALVGTWTGKTNMHGKEEAVTVTYELTSNGTTLVEKMSPGTPMEMMTVYATDGKTVSATHYCAVGNQPQFKLKTAKDNTFAFEMAGHHGVANHKKDMHMHGVTLTIDGNKLKQEWTNFDKGKKAGTAVFEFTKKI